MTRLLGTLTCILLLSTPVAATAEQIPAPRPIGTRTYSIAVIPFYSPEKIWQLYSPFVAYLNRTTKLTWELKLYHNHESLLSALCADEISLALLGPVPLARASNQCGVLPVLTALTTEGAASYRSVLLTGDPAVRTTADLAGKTIGFFKGSTAAHIMPAKMLLDAGVALRKSSIKYFESQERLMTALLRREVSAAGVKESLARKFAGEGVRILQTSEPLPHFAFCASPRLALPARAAFIEALTALNPRGRPVDRAVVASWDDEIKNGFIAPPARFLDDVLKLGGLYNEVMHALP